MKHGIALVAFDIPGPPMGKGRHRSFEQGGKTIHVADRKTESYEGQVKWFARLAMGKAGIHVPLDEPLWLNVTAFFQPPKALDKKLAASPWMPAPKKPDFDNIGKVIGDALNGILYRDDALIVDGRVIKRFDANPRVAVTVGRFIDELSAVCQTAHPHE